MYRHSVPMHEEVAKEQRDMLLRGGKLNVMQHYAQSVWEKLVDHANTGRCTCHAKNGEIHILAACVEGRILSEEYAIAVDRMKRGN